MVGKYLDCTVREDWEELTDSEEGGGTAGRAWAVTIELLELYNKGGTGGHHQLQSDTMGKPCQRIVTKLFSTHFNSFELIKKKSIYRTEWR